MAQDTPKTFTLTVNGAAQSVTATADTPLLWVLREELGLTGTRFGCGVGVCGACSVIVNGELTRSCLIPLSEMQGKTVRTVEGLKTGGKLHPVQEAWLAEQVPQCGYCQSGFLMAAVDLLAKKPHPTDADMAQITNICRCGTYPRIKAAIRRAAGAASVKRA